MPESQSQAGAVSCSECTRKCQTLLMLLICLHSCGVWVWEYTCTVGRYILDTGKGQQHYTMNKHLCFTLIIDRWGTGHPAHPHPPSPAASSFPSTAAILSFPCLLLLCLRCRQLKLLLLLLSLLFLRWRPPPLAVGLLLH